MRTLMLCVTAILAGLGLDRIMCRLIEQTHLPARWQMLTQDLSLVACIGVVFALLIWLLNQRPEGAPDKVSREIISETQEWM